MQAQEELKEAEMIKLLRDLYGITDEVLEEVKKALRVLKGENVVELGNILYRS